MEDWNVAHYAAEGDFVVVTNNARFPEALREAIATCQSAMASAHWRAAGVASVSGVILPAEPESTGLPRAQRGARPDGSHRPGA
jgi:hypothetical protein